eukprot:262799-Prymnesium_polylepis.1
MLDTALDRELQACCHTLSSVSASLAELAMVADEAPSRAATEDALQQVLDAAAELREAFAFVDELEHRVDEAASLVEATDRRLGALERGQSLPESIAQLPPAQFSVHQFSRQLRRRERGPDLELPELSALPPADVFVERPATDAAEASAGNAAELAELERLARTAATDARAAIASAAAATAARPDVAAAVSAAATAADQARSAAANAADGARTLFKRLQGEWRLP